jgi:hypothetical protein
MTVAEIMEQAQTLSLQERKELVKLLVDSLDVEQQTSREPDVHWGRALNALLDSLDMHDWEEISIDDPVEWVKQQRTGEQQRRLGDWGNET